MGKDPLTIYIGIFYFSKLEGLNLENKILIIALPSI